MDGNTRRGFWAGVVIAVVGGALGVGFILGGEERTATDTLACVENVKDARWKVTEEDVSEVEVQAAKEGLADKYERAGFDASTRWWEENGDKMTRLIAAAAYEVETDPLSPSAESLLDGSNALVADEKRTVEKACAKG